MVDPSTSSSDSSRGAEDEPATQRPTPAPTPTPRSRRERGGSRSAGSASGFASSASGSYSFDPDTVGYDPGWTREFPCEFYPPDADGCAAYRSCFDCLNSGVVYKGRVRMLMCVCVSYCCS